MTGSGPRSPSSGISHPSFWTRALLYHLIDRAALSELDRRYWTFVASLPPRLAQLAANPGVVAGEASSPLPVVTRLGFGLCLPWLFQDAFPGLRNVQLLDVGEAWLFLMAANLLRDHLVDAQVPVGSDAAELQERLMTKACDVFRSFVADRSRFWQRFEQYDQQVVSALQTEIQCRNSLGERYDLGTAWRIGFGKSAAQKTVPCAMAVVCGEMAFLPRVERSMDALAAGRQLLDDVVDWQEDLAHGHYTFPLALAAKQLRESGAAVSPQTVKATLSDSACLEDTLNQARDWHQQALEAVDGIPCQGWIEAVETAIADLAWNHRWLILDRIVQAARAQKVT